jgi:hypothetical protein
MLRRRPGDLFNDILSERTQFESIASSWDQWPRLFRAAR